MEGICAIEKQGSGYGGYEEWKPECDRGNRVDVARSTGCMSVFVPGAFFVYKNKIPYIYKQAAGLPEDEDRVPSQNGVNEKNPSATDTEIPEGDGHNAAALSLTGNPLDHEPAEK
jgi:hypothetical protein